jgi:hypothetical protein
MYAEECPFKVVRTNGGDEVLARAANLLIGRAAIETAKRMYPRDVLEYRRGAQVLAQRATGRGMMESGATATACACLHAAATTGPTATPLSSSQPPSSARS